ncbi:hypothetical protein GCM10010468_67420 [Actinocorallia longicatena]|uniref:Uncharacterized protein n=1 Tax=Actinocorallia longicatena TaxID=111803 RepID=A0ABP6QL36_9ACTN
MSAQHIPTPTTLAAPAPDSRDRGGFASVQILSGPHPSAEATPMGQLRPVPPMPQYPLVLPVRLSQRSGPTAQSHAPPQAAGVRCAGPAELGRTTHPLAESP